MPFEEGSLPVRYLGVPLISSRLLYKDCKVLIERMEKRITDWRNKSLSFAGRLQLVRSVLSSLHIYWASVFILPQRVIDDLESKMRRFLWNQGDTIKGKAKVAWKSLCVPKWEGGLGIRRIADFNKALMVKHVWSLLTGRDSLWVKWIHSHKLKGRSFWDIPIPQNCTWCWRKILQLRHQIRPHIWNKLGDGKSTSMWFDRWAEICPIRNYVSPRDIWRAGLSLQSTVSDLIDEGIWKWPMAWLDLFPVLIKLPNFQLQSDVNDTLIWKDAQGIEQPFCSTVVWDSIRCKQEEVTWHKSVWFPQMIPRHAFVMWLIMRRKLRTQDKMMQWCSGGNMNFNLVCCPLCTQGPDSHNHLFFDCDFSKQVWNQVRHLAQMNQVSSQWEHILDWLINRANSKSAKSVIGKLLVAASAYFIWQERNRRLFSNEVRKVEQIRDIVATSVRLKLVTLRFKSSNQVGKFVEAWNLPKGLVIYDP